MPKGALLHAHLEATVDVNFLLNRILEQNVLYVRASAPLTTLSPTPNALPEFSPFPGSAVRLSAVQCLTDPSYDGGWIPVRIARETFSPELGGPVGFDKWYVATTTINPAEAYGTHKTVEKVSLPAKPRSRGDR
jgi:adenosine deaminase CECR1